MYTAKYRVMATRITNQKLSKSSRDWMREHLDDPYVKKAQKEGYRARAAYKLLEMQEKYKIIKPGMTVLGPKGQFVVKVFQGSGFDEFRKQVVDSFDVLKTSKPLASRARSKEVFLIGQGRKKALK
ncbi:unnamed protein product [Cylicostephanus goldi]|uniref:rRNA methyltransferase 2, mitochondrial n=1 Tax=Cylicostephanus goldi TaxID=71465 RepID=A0A3P7N702_CYLGO|nr:unnamed protein product [Cylicostephanus goldi]